MTRIEAGLVFAGSEFCDQTDPFEAGIGFTVPLKSKEDDFIGRAAVERRKASPARKLVGLEIEGNLVPSGGDCVRVGRAQVGEVTSAMRSPVLGKVIALCRIDVTYAGEGTEVEIGQLHRQQKRIPAKVVRFPHFDPTKERVKGNYAWGAIVFPVIGGLILFSVVRFELLPLDGVLGHVFELISALGAGVVFGLMTFGFFGRYAAMIVGLITTVLWAWYFVGFLADYTVLLGSLTAYGFSTLICVSVSLASHEEFDFALIGERVRHFQEDAEQIEQAAAQTGLSAQGGQKWES